MQNPGENAPFMKKVVYDYVFLIEYPLKDFDEKGDSKGWDIRGLTAPRRIGLYKIKNLMKFM